MLVFNCQKAEDAIFNRKRKFLTNCANLDDLICYAFQNCANAEAGEYLVNKSFIYNELNHALSKNPLCTCHFRISTVMIIWKLVV